MIHCKENPVPLDYPDKMKLMSNECNDFRFVVGEDAVKVEIARELRTLPTKEIQEMVKPGVATKIWLENQLHGNTWEEEVADDCLMVKKKT